MSPILRRGGGSEKGPRPLRIPPLLGDALREGGVALEPGADAAKDALGVTVVIPQFRRGSGGHKTIADLVRGLEARGHDVALLLIDEEERHADAPDSELQRAFRAFFGDVRAPLHRLDPGARVPCDVLVATGWQTVPAVLRTPGARARAYLVQDHEPEFYATSVERDWAAWTYRQGLHAICASPWLAELVAREYGASATPFDLGVDHVAYAPAALLRREDLVLFYARAVTPRRGVALGVLALEELHRRRPDLEIGLFGEARELRTPFAHRHLGVLTPRDLRALYNSAAAGLVLSLTNPSLVPTEMLACGLPVVDLATPSMLATFGADGPIALAAPDPVAICAAIEEVLDALVIRSRRVRLGLELTAERTWARAAEQVEDGLRTALRATAP